MSMSDALSNDDKTPRSVEMLDNVRNSLRDWQGCHARLVEYVGSHSTLTIRLFREGTSENLHIICIGCKYIGSPHGVNSTTLRVERHSTNSGVYFLLLDERNEIKIQCGSIVTSPNVEPLFNIPPKHSPSES